MDAKERVKQNKKKCAHLLENLRALGPSLVDIEKSEGALAHRETLENIKIVVDEAETLLKQQFTRSYFTQFCLSSSVAEQFTDINQRLRDQRENLTASLTTRMATRLATQNSGSAPTSAPEEIIPETDLEVFRKWCDQSTELAQLWSADADPTTWKGVEFDDMGPVGRVRKLKLNPRSGRYLYDSDDDEDWEKPYGNDKFQNEAYELYLDAMHEHLRDPYSTDGETQSIKQILEPTRKHPASNEEETGDETAVRHLGELPKYFGLLNSIVTLDLSYCGLKSLPAEIGQLSDLSTLRLTGNMLFTLPSEIGFLTSLQILKLNDNRLRSLPEEVGFLASLILLDLSGNQLTSLNAELSRLKSLGYLHLGNNQLSSVSNLEEFGSDSKLTFLHLGDNRLKSLPPKVLDVKPSGSPHGHFLHLGGNKLKSFPALGTGLEVIQSLSEVACVIFADNQLTTIGFPARDDNTYSFIALAFQNNQLTSLPADIGLFTELRELYLDNNKLTELPAEIGQLEGLNRLNLDNNKLTTLPPEIGQLGDLWELTLSNNQLTTLPAEIGQICTLGLLDLDNNQLTSLPLENWPAKYLERLHLSGNKLTTLPAEIGQFKDLWGLVLNHNQLTTLPAEIGQLTSLQQLYLGWNQLTSLPAEIGQLKGLQKLYLGGNQLTSLPAEIGQLTSLRWLDLYRNKLTTLPDEIGQLTSLEELQLAGNQLKGAVNSKGIRELKAAGCDVAFELGELRVLA
jgi:leucine-rich repeat protein SHOC2